jgi:adenosylcobinamide kinase/adenosylcobinamide-phosphate guanylyltransferase
MSLTLILGGARSGKSDYALQLARESGRPVTFVATMEPLDEDLRARVARHRGERPAAWRTLEAPIMLVEALKDIRPGAFIVVDCITMWVSNLLLKALPAADAATPAEARAACNSIPGRVGALATWCASYDGIVAAVSNEVGSGVVPANALGRAFRDALGSANRALAARADRVFYVVAGLAADIKAQGATTVEYPGAGIP